ncbi:MAG TPA: translation elongation factor Ts [Steroidobacteraceae bacterium]|nr:translation elongation factor Ts [Steroidobacteraceae bacterium]
MAVTAEAVKALRERTGAGRMECKKALVETNGDIEAAAEIMRKAGLAKADKKAGRVAAEGLVVVATAPEGRQAAIVEVNCETDFVAREADFQAFAQSVAELALRERPGDLAALMELRIDGQTVEERRRELIAKIGENIGIRRYSLIEAPAALGAYVHGSRIGVVVALERGDEAVARDVAMHVAAMNPAFVSSDDVPSERVEKEREILSEQAKGEGKPEAIVAKMVEGRLRKWLAEITLLGQPFVKDPDQTVEKLLKGSDAKIAGFVRFELGEGIDKKQEDFAAEVMKQVRGG